MKRVILFVSLLLLTCVNSNAGNTPAEEPSALTADFSASVTSGCTPLVVQFTSTSTNNAGDPIISYTWDFGDGTIITTPNPNPSHTYTTTNPSELFTVKLTVRAQSGSTHTTTKTDYITAYEQPVFSLGNDTAICGSGSLCFFLPNGYDSYAWSQGSATTPYGCLNYTTGTNILWAEVTNGTCTYRDTMIVTGITGLTGKFGYEVINTCGTVDVQFYDSAVSCDPSFPPDYWEWIMDDDYGNGAYGEQNPVYTFATGGSHKVSYSVSNANGGVAVIESIIILPNPTPGPAPVNLGPDIDICQGGSVQLDAGNEPGATYLWSPATGLSSTTIYNPIASPAVTTTYTVIKSKCGIDAAPASITVNVNPPIVADLGPDQSMCPGGAITLDAGVTGATYKWGSTYSPAYSGMTTKTVIALGAGSYWVTVTKNGCEARDTIVITAKPAVDPLFTYAQTGFCSTLSVDFTDASIPCSGSITNYVWDFGDGTPAVSGYNPVLSHTYAVAGTKHVTLTVTTSGGFTDTYEEDIVVAGGTPPTVNLGAATTICSGDPVTLDAGNPGATYSWSPGGATTQSITVNPTVNTTYTVTVTKDGCSNSGSRAITVTPKPVINLGAATTICSGDPVTLDAGNAGATYSWSPGGATTQSITVNPTVNTTYTVTVTKDGCSNSGSRAITVTPKPVINLGAATTICSGDPVTLDAGNPGATYSWSPGGATTQSITVNPTVNTTYTVTVTKDGCSNSGSRAITVTPKPVINLGAATTICSGDPVTLDAGNAGATYSWSPGGATTQSITVNPTVNTTYTVTVTRNGCSASDSKDITVTTPPTVNLGADAAICSGSSTTLDAGDPGSGTTYSWSTGATTRTIAVNTAGTYTVTVTRNGCSASDSKDITVTTPPAVNLGADAAICAGSSTTLDAGDPGSGTTYSWSTGATTRTIAVNTAGTYTVTVTRNGCSASDSKDITVTTPPAVNLGADAAICAGSSTTLDAGDPGSGTTYSWSTGATTRTIAVNTAGTYTVTVTRNGCSASDSKDITVTTPPAVNLGADAAICSGSSTTLDAGDPGSGTTYSWSTGATTRTIAVNTAGTYTVTVTRNGCSASDSKDITVTTPPAVNLGADAAICAGSSTTLDAGDPGSGTTYSWSTGATTRTIAVNTAGTYTVTVTRNGCSASDSKDITVTTPPTVNLGADAAICAGSSTTLDAGDPGSGTTYSWSTGATTRTIAVNTAGTYTVTVTRNGCSASDSKDITVTTPPAVNLGADAAICAGSSTTLDAGDPGSGTTYSWSTGATTRTIAVNTAGTYTVTVTRNGCSASDSKDITVTTPPAVNLGADAAICSGSSTTLDAGDPGSGTTYSWSTGATTRTIAVNTAGTYTVTVTRNGCSASDSKDITVTTPPAVNLGADAAICAGSSTTLDAGDPGSGTTYSWSTGATTRTIAVNTAGTYTVTVTRNGCSASDSKDITVTTPPAVNLGADAAICSGSSTTLDAGDPGSGTTYSWSTGATTRTIAVNTAGTYTVTVTRNGCSASDSKDITVTTPPAVNLGADAAICAGSSTTLDAGDPGSGTTYSWSTGATTRTIAVNTAGTYTVTVTRNGCSASDSKDITVTTPPAVNLGADAAICSGSSTTLDAGDPGSGTTYSWSTGATTRTIAVNTAGTYTVTVTRNGCSASDSKDITVTTPPAVNLGADAAICAGSSTTLDAGDPGSGTTYSWSTGATTRTIAVNTAGTYTVTVTRNGCSASDSKDITVTTPPAVNLGADAAICSGSSTTLDAGDPGSGTTYSWSTGATTRTIAVNTAGTYTVTVTRNGCSASDSKDITVTTPPAVNLGADAAICAGSSTTLDAGDPGSGTTYSWSTGATTRTIAVNTAGTYTVTVTRNGCSASDSKDITVTTPPAVNLGADAAICAGSSTTLDAGDPGSGTTYSWSTGATTRTIAVNTAGTYTVTVTRNGCSASDSKDITVTTPPAVNLGADAAICAGSSTTLDAGDPGSGTTYSWSTGATTRTIAVNTAGTYTVTVTRNGCSASDSKDITVTTPPAVNLGADAAICAGSSTTLDAGDPGSGTTYSWSTGATTRTIAVNTAGTYTVTVTRNGCSASDSKDITVTTPPAVNLGADAAICAGSSTTLDAGDPGSGTTYSWSTGATTRTIAVNTAGTYTVTVTRNGCSASDSKDITVTTPPAVNLGADAAICAGSSTTLDAGDPGSGTTYSWSTGATTRTIAVNTAGTYTVTVTRNGCSASDSKDITVTTPPAVNLGADAAICSGSSTTLDAGDPGSGTTYSWSTGATTRTIAVNTAGTYTVTVTRNGCSASDSKDITVTTPPAVNLGADAAICAGSSTTLDAGDPGSGTTYSWSTGATTRTIAVNTAGTYTVTVTRNGCSASDSKDITVTTPPAVNLGADAAICSGSSTTLDAGDPGSGTTYSWSTGATTRTIAVNTAGTYTVTVTRNGCSASDSKDITVTTPPAVNLGADAAICAGSSTTLDAGDPGSGTTYSWSTGATTRTIAVNTAGTYTVTVTRNGCSASDSKDITVTTPPAVNLGADAAICAGSSTTLDAGDPGSGTTYSWSTGATTRTIAVNTAGTYTVTVTRNGCSASDSKDITVTTPPTVNLGADAAICAGSSTTLDAGDPGSGTTYSWSTGATTRTIAVNTAGTYTVTVTRNGCSASDSKDITVTTSGLVVNLGPDIERCTIGLPTKLDAGITGASYLWGSNPYVPTVANKTTKTVQTLTAGKFWVTVTKDGCSATDTIIVANKPNIIPRFTYTQTGSCSPIKVSFTDATEACSSISNYEWNFGDASPVLSGYNPNPEHNYDQPGLYKVTLTVSISGESKIYEEDIIVSGTGIPVNLGNDTTICAGSSITLDAGNHPGATYEWAPNGATTQSITVNSAGTYMVTVTNSGCKVIDAINVTVVPALTVALGNDTTICPGNPVILDAGNPGATYLWSTGETTRTISTDTAGNYSVTVSKGGCFGNGSVNIYVNSSLPVSLGSDTTICAGSSITFDAGYPGAIYTWNNSATSQTITVTDAGIYKVTVNNSGCVGEAEIELSLMATASPVNLGNDTIICFGNMITLDAGNPGAGYLWSTGATTQLISPMVTGIYSVEVTRCGITEKDTIDLVIANLPTPTITQLGNELVATDAENYQWYKNAALIPGATAKKYKPRGYGKYKVVVTSTGTGCSGESAEYFFVPEGHIYIGDIKVKISPNPGNGLAKLIFSKLPPKPIKVTVYDRVGRKILITTMNNTVNDINLVAYAKGEYFVECVLDDKRIIIPLVTQ